IYNIFIRNKNLDIKIYNMSNKIKNSNIIQLLSALVIIVLINYISSSFFLRLDLTSDNRYTLTKTTKQIIKSLDDVVYVQLYLEGDMPIGFKKMQKSINEMLDEFNIISNGNIEYEIINPSASDDKGKREAIYKDIYQRGLNPTNVHDKDKEGGTSQKILFPGAIITYKEKETAVNFLKNNPGYSSEQNLNNSVQAIEYKLVDAIRKLTVTEKQKIAFIEGHNELDEYEVGDITKSLSQYYLIDRVTIKGNINILEKYSTVIIAKPQTAFPEKDKFVIDQYIMNGGKVIWLIDPIKVSMDSLSTGSSTLAFINDLNLNDQLFTYGIRINPQIIQDVQCSLIPVNTALAGEKADFKPASWLYSPLITPPANNNITKDLNLIKTNFVSNIDILNSDKNIKQKILLRSSNKSKLTTAPFMVSLNQINDKINPSDFNSPYLPIAAMLEGEFNSVFKNRMINSFVDDKSYKLIEKSKSTKMLVIADGDIIKNDVRRRADGILISPLGLDRYTKQTYGNKEFIMNAVHYMTNEAELLKLRSKDIKLRILDKSKISQERLKWQLINVILPLVIIIIFGVLISRWRKYKYSK
ncbi:MAG: gliding motility-associated ABC transporter substrate-binding protein GldG, partial [Bacteroidota bacterium]|nr:gliding motility-associated ABC transporter substrate-binding protein GldG [Bacteroidota bacterium]